MDIVRVIYRHIIGPIDIDIESAIEIADIIERDIETQYLLEREQEGIWVAELVELEIERQILLDPEVISVTWINGNIHVITESDLYWGTY